MNGDFCYRHVDPFVFLNEIKINKMESMTDFHYKYITVLISQFSWTNTIQVLLTVCAS